MRFHSFSRDTLGPPFITLKVLNQGRRPVVITNLIKVVEGKEYSEVIAEPEGVGEMVTINNLEDPLSYFADLFSMENTSKILKEAEYFERFVVERGEVQDLVVEVSSGDYRFPEKLLVQDIRGRKYKVRKSSDVLKKFKAFSSAS
ncbi:hypothetical protein FHR95_001303 [Halomonas fontilapidosi]|uniref:Uncharacterized protein n=1 Tax=Halomonas fontilapidosi TaxID=616675 RepID=A0A7W5DIW5_9GAMM|nr:hypothetical protein [Halomonas fontilapidosi]MBB3183749.1 hypothetical protein [Halomonas fontilapidosi]